MTPFLIALHVIVSIFLIAVVLLQRGKGAEVGAVFGGGGSTTVFGSRGARNFLTRLTTGAAVIFMLTSLGLSYTYTTASSDRLFNEERAEGSEGTEAAPDKPLFEEVGVAPGAKAEPAPTAAADGADGLPALPAAEASDTSAQPAPGGTAAELPALPDATSPKNPGD